MRSSMKRNRLTLKKAEMISSCRFSNTSNPFIIYDFYGTLEKVCFIILTFLECLQLVVYKDEN